MKQSHALIVDDNTGNLDVLGELLTMCGVTHTKIRNPRTLHDVLPQIPQIHVIFLDLEMPGASGFELLRMFKSDARFARVPIVAYTVHISEIDVARTEGFDGFLAKPLNADHFPHQLARILNGQSVWMRV